MNDEFAKLFRYMEQRFDSIDTRLNQLSTKNDIDRIIRALDAIAKHQEINKDERIVMAHQLERLDQWVHALADKIGVQLSH